MQKSAFGCDETSPGDEITRACKMNIEIQKNGLINLNNNGVVLL